MENSERKGGSYTLTDRPSKKDMPPPTTLHIALPSGESLSQQGIAFALWGFSLAGQLGPIWPGERGVSTVADPLMPYGFLVQLRILMYIRRISIAGQ